MVIIRRRKFKAKHFSRSRALFFTLVIFLILMILLIQSFFFIDERLEPTLMIIATQKTDQLAKEAISEAVTKKMSPQGFKLKDLLQIEKDTDGNIQAFTFNFQEYSRVIGESNQRIKDTLEELEKNKVKQYVPLGLATGNHFLAEMGPNIPVTLVPIGSVQSKLDMKLSEAGINMVLATVYLHVEVDLKIVIPFSTQQITVTNDIPIATVLVVGDVPSYLYNNPLGKPDVPLKEADLKTN
ncbi:sporulation protein YunB [Brevibacillus centrosporus]|uniref:sporulation protein YunB n=1 Tax=Brevibacillus centrosporus TaxID=54910 RepID=UPI003B010626